MSVPKTMRAVVLTGHGGLDKLEYREDWPTPVPAAGEVLVRVGACGLNNTDINTRTAWYSKTVTAGITDAGGKDLQLTGATIVPPGTMQRLVGLIEQNLLKPLLAQSFPLKDLGKAQETFLQKKHVGNIVVEI